MALDHAEARLSAERWVDAFNRRDEEAALQPYHETMTLRSEMVHRHLGHEHRRIEGREAIRELHNRMWTADPSHRLEFEEVFSGPDGYVLLCRQTHDGRRVVLVRTLDQDGLVSDQRAFHAPPLA